MAELSEHSWATRLFIKNYRWREIKPTPWAPLRKPLRECKLGLVTSAGFLVPGQKGFDQYWPGGDISYRVIPMDVNVRTLIEDHRSPTFDHAGINADQNLALPLDRARELAAQGKIAALNGRAISFMGSLTAVGRLTTRTAPEAARLFVEDQVDVALLTPV
ncbi:MAG TPA: glycine/sarcosine/betaine reductase selenoprotein B family protein [Methylomirabilota bacterium]|nr:glycine/sarcosine/betaine reductase selenoprotein B family protein [Methylomirabilota bacterium]